MQDDVAPTPQGLLRCLQALAEEASCLTMRNTMAAIHDAIAICQREGASVRAGQSKALAIGLLH